MEEPCCYLNTGVYYKHRSVDREDSWSRSHAGWGRADICPERSDHKWTVLSSSVHTCYWNVSRMCLLWPPLISSHFPAPCANNHVHYLCSRTPNDVFFFVCGYRCVWWQGFGICVGTSESDRGSEREWAKSGGAEWMNVCSYEERVQSEERYPS